jgi:hypothetical protein
VRDYDEAIRLAPEDGGLFVDRGKMLRFQSKFEQAISDFSDALQLGTKWTAAYPVRGLTYMLTGQPQPAIVDLATYDQLQLGDQEADYLEPALAQSRIPSLELVDRSRAAERI